VEDIFLKITETLSNYHLNGKEFCSAVSDGVKNMVGRNSGIVV
jgi:hypothetical protein